MLSLFFRFKTQPKCLFQLNRFAYSISICKSPRSQWSRPNNPQISSVSVVVPFSISDRWFLFSELRALHLQVFPPPIGALSSPRAISCPIRSSCSPEVFVGSHLLRLRSSDLRSLFFTLSGRLQRGLPSWASGNIATAPREGNLYFLRSWRKLPSNVQVFLGFTRATRESYCAKCFLRPQFTEDFRSLIIFISSSICTN